MGDYRYKAFISYSHADEAWGGWLQKSLEAFRLPKGLTGVAAGKGAAGLKPVFRDREDLPAAGSLNAEIQKALSESEHLVVICSPNAVRSPWVNEEIKLFKRLHGGDKVLALITDGEPGDPARECFPEALRFAVDESGAVTETSVEPLAADAREIGDGKRAAFLKIAAGLLGVRLDELVHRDAQRRTRRMRIVGAIGAGITVSMAALAMSATLARREAEFQRNKAEELVEFMLTDLRIRLEPYGRLDALEAVGDKALDYYADQNMRDADPDALGRRARALLLVGEIESDRGNRDAGLEAYLAAAATTEELLRREPNNPDRIFDHAQSAFYVGEVGFDRGDYQTTEKYYGEYLRLAERLIEIDPDDPKWRLEYAYATSNLGSLMLRLSRHEQARALFNESVKVRTGLLDENPDDVNAINNLAYAMSWGVTNYLNWNRFSEAQELVLRQLELNERAFAIDPENYKPLFQHSVALRSLGYAQFAQGRVAQARTICLRSLEAYEKLLARDSSNASARRSSSGLLAELSMLEYYDGNQELAFAYAEKALAASDIPELRDKNALESQAARLRALAMAVSSAPDKKSRTAAEKELRQLVENPLATDRTGYVGAVLLGALSLSSQMGDGPARNSLAQRAIDYGAPFQEILSFENMTSLAELYLLNGDFKKAAELDRRMTAAEFKHPKYAFFHERLQLFRD